MTLASRLFTLLFLLSCANSAIAQPPAQTPQSPHSLDPFPVVGTRLPTKDVEVSPAVVVLDRDFIERSGATDLATVLNVLPQTYRGVGAGAGTVPNGAPSYGTARSLFNFTTGALAPLRQTGVSSVGLRGLGAAGTLVLIDGRRMPLAVEEDLASDTGAGFYDLSNIPLGLVERIEVLSEGASAIHGSDAIGGVVNVVLRRNYTGSELTTGFQATHDGGAFERSATLTTGIARDKLNLLFAVTGRSRNALKASQRTFSSTQNLTELGGRDHRLAVGSPAIVSAAVGTLAGLTDPNGAPVRFALVPTGQDGTGLSTSDLEGVGGFFSNNLRRFDAAAYRDLMGAEEQTGLRASGTYNATENLTAYVQASWSDQSSETAHEPPATAGGGFGGTDSRVPANNPRNPFDQDVLVSLVHVEAPARPQFVDTSTTRVTAGLRGVIRENWQWDTAASFSHQRFDSRTQDLDTVAFVSALAEGRFNPFGDPFSHGPINTSLYDDLLSTARIKGSSRVTTFDATLRGPVFSLAGGEALLATGGETLREQRHRDSTDPVFGQPQEITSARTSAAWFAELYLPLASGDTLGLNRLDARLAVRYEHRSVFSQTSPQLNLSWEPVSSITLHGRYGEGFRAPSLTEFEDSQRTTIDAINDPQFGGENYDVTIIRGGNPQLTAEKSQSYQFGISVRPPFITGLSIQALTAERYYTNKLNTLGQQTIVDFESRFPGRVIRGADNRITQLDATTINFGKIYTRSLDLGISYQREFAATGRWALRIDAVQQLEYRNETRPDRAGAEVSNGADTASPPGWSGFASLLWNKGNWDATVLVQSIAGFESNASGSFLDLSTSTPSWTSIDLRAGYRFTAGVWRGYGKGLHVQLGIGNIANRAPPFANTVYGYNQALYSPLGRTYDLTVRLPF